MILSKYGSLQRLRSPRSERNLSFINLSLKKMKGEIVNRPHPNNILLTAGNQLAKLLPDIL